MGAPATPVELRLPGGAEAPPTARAAVTAHLGTHLDPTRLDDLLLATSEVVTNAVVHAGAGPGQQLGLRLTRDVGVVRVAVTDPAPARSARIKPRDPIEPGGLGLVLVDQLSERWGVEHRDLGTKEVWFEFLLTPPAPDARTRAAAAVTSQRREDGGRVSSDGA